MGQDFLDIQYFCRYQGEDQTAASRNSQTKAAVVWETGQTSFVPFKFPGLSLAHLFSPRPVIGLNV